MSEFIKRLSKQERRGYLEQKMRQNMARSLASLHPTIPAAEFDRIALFLSKRGVSSEQMRQHLINLALIRESGCRESLDYNLTLEQASVRANGIMTGRRNPRFFVGRDVIDYHYPEGDGPPTVTTWRRW